MKRLAILILFCAACSGVALAQWAAVLGASRSSGAATPAWGGEVMRTTVGVASKNSSTITLTGAVGTGTVLVIMAGVGNRDTPDSVTSITDSSGNTYTIQAQGYNGDEANRWVIATAPITVALTTSSTITMNFANTATSGEGWILDVINNATTVELTSSVQNGYSGSLTPSATITHAPSVQVGFAYLTQTLTLTSWTSAGAMYRDFNPFYNNAAGTGTIGPTGTYSAAVCSSVFVSAY